MTILVTGGAGYIGSHTCIALLDAGYDIVSFDNFSNSKPAVVEHIKQITGKDFPFYKADLLDQTALETIFSECQIDSVMHFAGLKAVGESSESPLLYYQNNVGGTIMLLQTMVTHQVKQMIFSSSATVYGNPQTIPVNEDMSLYATNPYGSTKLTIENMLRDIYMSDPTWSIALLRYFNPIGAHKSGLIGDDPNGIPNNLMPYIVKVVIGQLPILNVFGNDYPTKDGTGVRDYIHVLDLSEGHIRALEQINHIHGIHTYNLGTGTGYSVLDVIHAFEAACGQKINYQVVPRRAGDIAECYADPTKANVEMNWKATRSLSEMCADTWEFAKKIKTKTSDYGKECVF